MKAAAKQAAWRPAPESALSPETSPLSPLAGLSRKPSCSPPPSRGRGWGRGGSGAQKTILCARIDRRTPLSPATSLHQRRWPFRHVQACAGRLGAAALSPREGGGRNTRDKSVLRQPVARLSRKGAGFFSFPQPHPLAPLHQWRGETCASSLPLGERSGERVGGKAGIGASRCCHRSRRQPPPLPSLSGGGCNSRSPRRQTS